MSEAQEEWRDIKGVPNFEISSEGRVRWTHEGREAIVSPIKNAGEVVVRLTNPETGNQEFYSMAQIMIDNWIITPPRAHEFKLGHRNGNLFDFSVDNLVWRR